MERKMKTKATANELVGALATWNADPFLVENEEMAKELSDFTKKSVPFLFIPEDEGFGQLMEKLELTWHNKPKKIHVYSNYDRSLTVCYPNDYVSSISPSDLSEPAVKHRYTTDTAEESYKAYEEARKAYDEAGETCPEGVDFFRHRDELEKKMLQAMKEIFPVVGKGCTICYWSDKRAATVVKVELTKSGQPKAVEVRFNETKCTNYYAGTYEVLPELEGASKRFTLRKNGLWFAEGQETSRNSVRLVLHYQHHFIDPEF